MKAKQLLIVTVSILLLQINLSAQSYKLKTFKMAVNGTSTMHDWESRVKKLECKSSYKIEDHQLIDIKEAVIKVAVEDIKSEKGRIMDSKTYDAFDSKKNPNIVFTLSSETINPINLTATLKGTLTMAGATRPIDVTIAYKVLANGDLQITGSKKLKMTDYKMEPPTAMMGAIEVGDEVTIHFDLLLSSMTTNL